MNASKSTVLPYPEVLKIIAQASASREDVLAKARSLIKTGRTVVDGVEYRLTERRRLAASNPV